MITEGWFKVYEGMYTHRKTKRLARDLGINQREAAGTLLALWTWAFRAAPDGDLSRFRPVHVADAIDWLGDPDALVAALVAAEWIDADQRLHEWEEYAGLLHASRGKEADRKRSSRGHPRDVRAGANANQPLTTVSDEPRDGADANMRAHTTDRITRTGADVLRTVPDIRTCPADPSSREEVDEREETRDQRLEIKDEDEDAPSAAEAELGKVILYWEHATGTTVYPRVAEDIADFFEEGADASVICNGIDEAVRSTNKSPPSWKYAKTIIERMVRDGVREVRYANGHRRENAGRVVRHGGTTDDEIAIIQARSVGAT